MTESHTQDPNKGNMGTVLTKYCSGQKKNLQDKMETFDNLPYWAKKLCMYSDNPVSPFFLRIQIDRGYTREDITQFIKRAEREIYNFNYPGLK